MLTVKESTTLLARVVTMSAVVAACYVLLTLALAKSPGAHSSILSPAYSGAQNSERSERSGCNERNE